MVAENEHWQPEPAEGLVARVLHDPVNPRHYADLGEYSALHVLERWGLDFHTGNALKYIQRAGNKASEPEVRDLKKAVWYLQRKIHLLDPSEPDPAAGRD